MSGAINRLSPSIPWILSSSPAEVQLPKTAATKNCIYSFVFREKAIIATVAVEVEKGNIICLSCMDGDEPIENTNTVIRAIGTWQKMSENGLDSPLPSLGSIPSGCLCSFVPFFALRAHSHNHFGCPKEFFVCNWRKSEGQIHPEGRGRRNDGTNRKEE